MLNFPILIWYSSLLLNLEIIIICFLWLDLLYFSKILVWGVANSLSCAGQNIELGLVGLWLNIKLGLVGLWQNIELGLVGLWQNIELGLVGLWQNIELGLVGLWQNIELGLFGLWQNIEFMLVGLWQNIEASWLSSQGVALLFKARVWHCSLKPGCGIAI